MTKRKRIGILCDNYYGHYQQSICRGIEKQAKLSGASVLYYDALIHTASYHNSEQERYIYTLPRHHNFLDGIIVFSVSIKSIIPASELTKILNSLKQTNICTLSVPHPNAKTILIDNEKGIRDVVLHFYQEHDVKKIAYIGGPSGVEDADKRYAAFKQSVRECGMSFDESKHYYEGNFQRYSGNKAVNQWIDKDVLDFEAIVCANDEMAFGCVQELLNHSIQVPDQIKVSGFDDVDFCSIFEPHLTTIRQPLEEQGMNAVQVVLNPEKHGDIVELGTELKIRNSCCKNQYRTAEIKSSIEHEVSILSAFKVKLKELLSSYFDKNAVAKIFEDHLHKDINEDNFEELRIYLLPIIDHITALAARASISAEFHSSFLRILINSFYIKYKYRDISEFIEEIQEYLLKKTQSFLSKTQEALHWQGWKFFSFSMDLYQVRELKDLWPLCNRTLPILEINNCCILMASNPIDISSQNTWVQPGYLINAYTYINGKQSLKQSGELIPTSSFFPKDFFDAELNVIIKPLHFQDEFFGYFIAGLEEGVTPYFYDHIKFSLLKIFQDFTAMQKLTKSKELIEQENFKINNLLKLSKEGFLSFRKDLKIQNQYSAECLRIFQKDIRGKKFSSLIYPNDTSAAEMIDNIFNRMFNDEESSTASFQSLLPQELEINSKKIQLEYSLLSNSKYPEIMIILQDITEKIKIEQQKEDKESEEQIFLKILSEPDFYFTTINSFEPFIEALIKTPLTKSNYSKNNLEKLTRDIHTFKGLFLQVALKKVAKTLNELEDLLFVMINTYDMPEKNKIETIATTEAISKCYETYIKEKMNIDNSIGKVLDTKKGIYTNRNDFDDIINYLLSHKGKELTEDCIDKVKSLMYKPLYKLLEVYIDYTQSLAAEIEKEIFPLKIYSDDVLVDQEKLMPLIQSLSHIFKNAIVHGIEEPYKRESVGKDTKGIIQCDIRLLTESQVRITISDDGEGIDTEKLLQKAQALELNIEEYSNPNYLIFHHSLSTHDEVNLQSGRGVGLSAVKEELEKINGTIEVESNLGQGTTFLLEFPI